MRFCGTILLLFTVAYGVILYYAGTAGGDAMA